MKTGDFVRVIALTRKMKNRIQNYGNKYQVMKIEWPNVLLKSTKNKDYEFWGKIATDIMIKED